VESNSKQGEIILKLEVSCVSNVSVKQSQGLVPSSEDAIVLFEVKCVVVVTRTDNT
jgi:hypothetical protein